MPVNIPYNHILRLPALHISIENCFKKNFLINSYNLLSCKPISDKNFFFSYLLLCMDGWLHLISSITYLLLPSKVHIRSNFIIQVLPWYYYTFKNTHMITLEPLIQNQSTICTTEFVLHIYFILEHIIHSWSE